VKVVLDPEPEPDPDPELADSARGISCRVCSRDIGVEASEEAAARFRAASR